MLLCIFKTTPLMFASSFFFDHIGIHFSPEEVVLFTKRMENGYDLTHDQRYNLWRSMHSSSDLTSFGKCVTE